MNPLDAGDVATILAGRSDWIGPDVQSELARHPLDSLHTEYPHYVGSVEDSDGPERPSEQHPVFYGCFDWHSAVHSHWSLVRLLRLFPDHPEAAEIVDRIDGGLTDDGVEQEVTYFEDNPSFEKPYGWGWFLRLVAELELWDDERADRWHETLAPLEATIVDLVETEFLPQERPFRVGTHGNSAFALACVLDYARVTGSDSLADAAATTARRFYADDADYPVEYEPLGWDFLSPALTEADLMWRVLEDDAFEVWLDDFLPDVTEPPYDAVLEPVTVEEGSDGGVELHLVGLNLAKAWCLAGLASSVDGPRFSAAFERAAEAHAEAGLSKAFTGDYAGAHWLTSFVLYLLTRNEGGIAPG